MIRSLGAVSTLVVMDTEPALTVPEPSESEPLVKAIVPVAPVGTDASIVIVWPKVLGPDVVTVTVGVALLTTWTSTGDELELNFAVML